jgi:peptidoglycan-associated lipoprotein
MRRMRVLAGCLLLAPVLAGCATKGQLRTVAAEQEAALAAERTQRVAADQRLGADVAALRADLLALRNDVQALRDDFGARIAAVEQGLQFALPIHFAFDAAAVRQEDHAALERFTAVVNRHYAGALVTVEGFADPAGSTAYNRRLSQRRADAVRDHLVGLGIQAQLKAVGMGESRPVVSGAAKDRTGAELNRRVVFVIDSPAARQPVTLLDRN